MSIQTCIMHLKLTSTEAHPACTRKFFRLQNLSKLLFHAPGDRRMRDCNINIHSFRTDQSVKTHIVQFASFCTRTGWTWEAFLCLEKSLATTNRATGAGVPCVGGAISNAHYSNGLSYWVKDFLIFFCYNPPIQEKAITQNSVCVISVSFVGKSCIHASNWNYSRININQRYINSKTHWIILHDMMSQLLPLSQNKFSLKGVTHLSIIILLQLRLK